MKKKVIEFVKAFTLVEVVMAAAVLAIALSMLLGSFMAARHSASVADYRLEAMNIARERLENLMTLSYNDPALNENTHSLQFTFSTLDGGVYSAYSASNTVYSGFYTISTNSSFPGTKDICVTITWMSPGASTTSSISLNASMSRIVH